MPTTRSSLLAPFAPKVTKRLAFYPLMLASDYAKLTSRKLPPNAALETLVTEIVAVLPHYKDGRVIAHSELHDDLLLTLTVGVLKTDPEVLLNAVPYQVIRKLYEYTQQLKPNTVSTTLHRDTCHYTWTEVQDGLERRMGVLAKLHLQHFAAITAKKPNRCTPARKNSPRV